MTDGTNAHWTTRADRLKALIDANKALARVDSLEDLLPTLLHLAQDVTRAEGASILLYKPEKQVLEFTLAINDYEQAARELMDSGMEIQLGQGIAGHVAQTREPCNIEDAYLDERFFKRSDETSGFITRSLLCVPIVNKEDLLGVVQVVNSKDHDNFSQEDLDVLQSFADLAGVALLRAQMLDAMLRQERIQAQLDVAARIQENFLPALPDLGEDIGIWAQTRPAIHVGGDFYDCVPMDDGSYIVAVADVSGKGLPAALVAASMWTHLRTICSRADSPQRILAQLNRQMMPVLRGELFATIILARFWPDSSHVRIAAGGHLPPFLVESTGVHQIEGLEGMPLGIEESEIFSEVHVDLMPSSSIVFITDGVTEARQSSGAFFGMKKLLTELASAISFPKGPALVESVGAWLANNPQNDDITVLEIWRR